jgi:alpha-L-fucosidase 2
MSIVRVVLDATDRAAAILDTGAALRRRIAIARAKLPPIRLGPDGRILEWFKPYQEAEPGHRHVSHLLGLHPFDLITRQTPELFDAARKTLDFRLAHGAANCSWSRAWMVSFFARLGDGEAAHQQTLALLRHSTQPNLFNNIPLFQIDGNLAATAGVCEMLLQSHERVPGKEPAHQEFVLNFLPALPKAWPSGSVQGLRARGGFTVDLHWDHGRVSSYRLRSATPRDATIRLNGEQKVVRSEAPGT